MKKTAVILAIIVLMILASCSGSIKDNVNQPEESPEASVIIAYISPVSVIETETPEHVENSLTPAATPSAEAPKETPTAEPTATPTAAPTKTPTAAPTDTPTPEPTKAPTAAPTAAPTKTLSPTPTPTRAPKTPLPPETPTPEPTPEPTPYDPYAYIERAISPVDFNQNGIDDYTDILIGARKDAINHPRYDASYQKNGYPPDDVGVCSDVVWRAFREAGYSLRYMVDKDIKENTWRYPQIAKGKEKRDNKIDFRRVRNLRIFFDEYAVILTTDIYDIEEWQPGDIVIFNNNTHIGIVSDKRNERGIPYIIHNGGQAEREQDYLEGDHKVAAHYRFDASRVPEDMLIPWEG